MTSLVLGNGIICICITYPFTDLRKTCKAPYITVVYQETLKNVDYVSKQILIPIRIHLHTNCIVSHLLKKSTIHPNRYCILF